MNEQEIKRAMEIAKMEGGTYHPGVVKALAQLINTYGMGAIERIEKKDLNYTEVWTLYNDECKGDVALMYEKLQS